MSKTTPSRTAGALRVLIAGGGVAALETMLALRALAEERVEVELLAPEHHFWYRPLAVAEPFEAGRVDRFELAELTKASGARFTRGELASVDPRARLARTGHGLDLEYDVLVIACGTTPTTALEGALTFRGPADVDAFRRLLDEAEAEGAGRLVFAVPGGVVWPLALYELALGTSAELAERGLAGIGLALVTPEHRPLEIFGRAASDAVAQLLGDRDIALHTGRYPVSIEDGELRLIPSGRISAKRVVALPRLEGPRIPGLPRDAQGFIPTDRFGQVRGLADVYAAGDITDFPVKQGGLATQQADAVAEAVASRAGAAIDPRPFRPVLRGLLLTGKVPVYLRAELEGGRGETSIVATETLWWPPAKISGRHLAPFLASLADVELAPPAPGPGVLPVEVELADQGDAE